MGHSYLEILEVVDCYCDRSDFNLPDLQVVDKLNNYTDYFVILRERTQSFFTLDFIPDKRRINVLLIIALLRFL
jgi:hypothetical protein